MIQVNRRNDLGSRMRRSLLVILLFEATFHPITAPECCPTKTLRNAPAEDSDLNGVYILKTKMDSKPDAVCVDTCVYVKDNKEYCFKEQEGATPTVVCEVAKNIITHLWAHLILFVLFFRLFNLILGFFLSNT